MISEGFNMKKYMDIAKEVKFFGSNIDQFNKNELLTVIGFLDEHIKEIEKQSNLHLDIIKLMRSQ